MTNCGGAGGGPAAAMRTTAVHASATISDGVEKRYMYPSRRRYCHAAGSAAAIGLATRVAWEGDSGLPSPSPLPQAGEGKNLIRPRPCALPPLPLAGEGWGEGKPASPLPTASEPQPTPV